MNVSGFVMYLKQKQLEYFLDPAAQILIPFVFNWSKMNIFAFWPVGWRAI